MFDPPGMESLSEEELRTTLTSILKLAECLVCHGTLTPKVVLCVVGHAVCEPCHQRLQNTNSKGCPLCRGPFSREQPTQLISQLIEVLPHTCRHENCDYFVPTNDDHEKFCTFKQTKCRLCDWSGPEGELVVHLKSQHTQARAHLDFPSGMATPFDPKKECSVFTPIFFEGKFFWGEMKNEPKVEKLTAVFHSVGNGKTTEEFQGTVKLGLDGGYKANIKLNMEPEVDPYKENCISIPPSILSKYTDDNKLMYTLIVEVTNITLESFTSSIQSGIKSGFEFLKLLPDKFK